MISSQTYFAAAKDSSKQIHRALPLLITAIEGSTERSERHTESLIEPRRLEDSCDAISLNDLTVKAAKMLNSRARFS